MIELVGYQGKWWKFLGKEYLSYQFKKGNKVFSVNSSRRVGLSKENEKLEILRVYNTPI
jgi:hypothetical protein